MVSLATLRFFCIRPTILALLNFTDAITTDILEPTPREDSMSTKPITDDNEASQPLLDHKDSIVKGLLGSGKERTLFSLMLNMHHAVFILNADNGSQIASLAQENMNCNIKVTL
jgi:vacuolar protein sorting-associated protein 13A/C